MNDLSPPVDKPVIVPGSALSPIVLTLLRYALTALGTVMVSRGILDEGAVDSLVGALLIIIPTVWGAVLTKRDNAEKVTMAKELDDSIAQVRP